MPHRSVDTAALAEVWNRAAGVHPLPCELIDEITAGDPSFRAGDVLVEFVGDRLAGFVVAKRLRRAYLGCERYHDTGYVPLLAVDPEFQGRGVASRLLARAEAQLLLDGARRVVLGGSFHHAVPAIPLALPPAAGFFLRRGYALEERRIWDVARDVRAFVLPERVPTSLHEAGATVRVVSSRFAMSLEPEATAALLEFLHAEFPGRWCRDVAHAMGRLDASSHVMALFSGLRVVGFAQLHLPGSPGTLRWQGFDPEVAAIGPVGVARSMQGKGLGLAVVALAADHLRRLGARRVVIDWTDLVEFYGKLGFEPWLSYVPGGKTL